MLNGIHLPNHRFFCSVGKTCKDTKLRYFLDRSIRIRILLKYPGVKACIGNAGAVQTGGACFNNTVINVLCLNQGTRSRRAGNSTYKWLMIYIYTQISFSMQRDIEFPSLTNDKTHGVSVVFMESMDGFPNQAALCNALRTGTVTTYLLCGQGIIRLRHSISKALDYNLSMPSNYHKREALRSKDHGVPAHMQVSQYASLLGCTQKYSVICKYNVAMSLNLNSTM